MLHVDLACFCSSLCKYTRIGLYPVLLTFPLHHQVHIDSRKRPDQAKPAASQANKMGMALQWEIEWRYEKVYRILCMCTSKDKNAIMLKEFPMDLTSYCNVKRQSVACRGFECPKNIVRARESNSGFGQKCKSWLNGSTKLTTRPNRFDLKLLWQPATLLRPLVWGTI